MNDLRNKVFLAVTCGFLVIMMLVAPALKIFDNLGIISTEKMGNIIEPQKVYDDDMPLSGLFNGIEKLKTAIEDTYINYLPFYAHVVTSVKMCIRDRNRPINELLSNLGQKAIEVSVTTDILEAPETEPEAETEAETAPVEEKPYIIKHSYRYITNSGGTNFYVIDAEYSDGRKVSLITLTLSTSPNLIDRRMRHSAELVNNIASVCKELGVKVYFYACSRFQDGENFEQYIPVEKSLKPKVDEFFSLLDPYIKYDRLKVDTLEESIEKLFLTDHHWNAYGMYEAYCDIICMMREDTSSIPEPRPLGELYVIEGAEFFGTNARISGYYECKDTFFFYDYDLPEHVLRASYPYNYDEKKRQYLEGRFEKKLSTDHYVNFYPYTEYMKYKNSTGRNVLVLADSYSRGISELLGSNFDETHIFDYRRIHEIGNLRQFIARHKITDVLFMQYSLRGIFDNQNDNTLHLIDLN